MRKRTRLLATGISLAIAAAASRAVEPLSTSLSTSDWAGLRAAYDANRPAHSRQALMSFRLAQQAYLKASNSATGDWFGHTVAVSGDTVVVGAVGEDSSATGINGDETNDNAEESGAAYVFVCSAGVWTQEAYLKASNTEESDRFGYSVAIDEDTIVVGAWSEDSGVTGVNGDQADNSAPHSGAAYVFVRSDGVWSQQAYLKPSNTGAVDYFGTAVAIDGDTLVVGSNFEDSSATGVNGNGFDNSAPEAGAAYVFVRDDGVWTEQAYLKASNTEPYEYFGQTVAIDGDTVVVGSWGEDSSATGVNGDQANNNATDSGAAYVFVRANGVWSQQAYLKASNPGQDDLFGISVAVSGDTLAVGAYLEDSLAAGVNGNQSDNSAAESGAAYVFVRNAAVWTQQAYLKASNPDEGDLFGWSMAMSGDTLLVGALSEDSSATGVDGNGADNGAPDSGAAYVFQRSGDVWRPEGYLKASNTGAGDYVGFSAAAHGNVVVVATFGEDSSATGMNGNQADNSAADSGAAYVFTLPAQLPGDMNCDGLVTVSDVAGFVLALTDPTEYANLFPQCDIINADVNADATVSVADIGPFVQVLTSG